MATKISKVKVSSYQKLKAKNEDLKFLLDMIFTQPQSKTTRDLRMIYKLDNNIEWEHYL